MKNGRAWWVRECTESIVLRRVRKGSVSDELMQSRWRRRKKMMMAFGYMIKFLFNLHADMRKRCHCTAWKHMVDMKLEQKTKHSGTMGTHERERSGPVLCVCIYRLHACK